MVDGEQGDDPSCRPNQIFAILASASGSRRDHVWEPVLNVVKERLADACGPAIARARPARITSRSTDGDLRSRDAAYHQGTVWAWLIGPVY